MDNLVSIIIPVYNAEKYIKQCIESVLKQTYNAFELLIIDDGSTDFSGKICDEYMLFTEKVQVFHQKNLGVSAARNVGLEHARGKFIVFIDADDILTEDSVERRIFEIGDADLLIGSYDVVNDDMNIIKEMPKCVKYNWNQGEAIKNLFEGAEIGYQGYLWNKMFRKKIIMDNKIKFKNGVAYNEDCLFMLEYLLRCNYIKLIDAKLYFYRENKNSAMGSLNYITDKDYEKVMTEFEAFRCMQKLLKEKNMEVYYLCRRNALNRAIFFCKNISKSEVMLRKGLKKQIRMNAIGVLSAPKSILSIKDRIKCLGHALLSR